jgi:sugar phosphate permease
MSLALASSYFAVMGAKCALPSVLSLLTSTIQQGGMTFVQHHAAAAGTSATARSLLPTTPQNQMARLLGLSTLAVATGKLVLGPVIDSAGGIRSLQICLFLLSSLLVVTSCTQQFRAFAVAWVFVDFIFSACWAAAINAIHQSFPENEWGKQIGHLATGARTGNAAAFSLFALILHCLEGRMKQPWRVVFLSSAGLQLLPLGLLSYFGSMTLKRQRIDGLRITNRPQKEAKTDEFPPAAADTTKNPFQILRREASTAPEFWLHLVSRSCLMVFASFLLFVPTLMSQVYGYSNAGSAQVASLYSLGCLVSVSFGSPMYSSLSKTNKVLAISSLLGLATACSVLQLAHVSSWITLSPIVGAISMFVWGFAFSIPFYLPPSLYALERGGSQGSATICDGFDFFGFALLAVFNGYVASIRHAQPADWIGCFQITTWCSLIPLLAQPLAVMLQ